MAEIRFIDRDPQGKICGIYACRQRDGQESLAEDSAELVAHLAAIEQERVTTQATELARAEKLRILADYLRSASRNVQETFLDLRQDMTTLQKEGAALKARVAALEAKVP